ncbi:MAG: hypothetical protein U0324_44260 [Polyangiales bacterium]
MLTTPKASDPSAPSAPPARSRWGRWVFRACLAVGLYFATVTFLLAIGVIKPRLEKVAIFRDLGEHGDILVCPASELHDCTLRVGLSSGRDLTAAAATIAWQAGCDDQISRIHGLCWERYPIANYDDEAQVRLNSACEASNGLFESRFMRRGDPRDAHLPPNTVVLSCREGEMTATFRDGQ